MAVQLARVSLEREAWMYENERALGSVRRGFEQAKAKELAKGPDLAAAVAFAEQLEDED